MFILAQIVILVTLFRVVIQILDPIGQNDNNNVEYGSREEQPDSQSVQSVPELIGVIDPTIASLAALLFPYKTRRVCDRAVDQRVGYECWNRISS